MSQPLDSTNVAAQALAANLGQLAELLEQIPDAVYATPPPGGVSGSVGAHVRHCLDHVTAVLHRSRDGAMTYDHRRRDTLLEHNRRHGIAALWQVVTVLSGLGDAPLADADLVRLKAQVDRRGGRVEVVSSVGRELLFVLQHTIHHQAVIALILAERGVSIPAAFGYASSTPVRARADARR